MNQYACAITGHRPTRFCFGYNEEDPLCQKLKECLLEQFRILHDEKFVRTFFVGGALGVDMWAGEQLLTLRAQTGYEDIKKADPKRKRFHCYFTFCGCFQL